MTKHTPGAMRAARRLYSASLIDQHEEPLATKIISEETAAPDLLAALERAEMRIAWHEGSTPLQQELLALCNKVRANAHGEG